MIMRLPIIRLVILIALLLVMDNESRGTLEPLMLPTSAELPVTFDAL